VIDEGEKPAFDFSDATTIWPTIQEMKDHATLHDLCRLRSTLEAFGVCRWRQCGERLHVGSELRNQLGELQRLAKRGDYLAFHNVDQQFHRIAVSAAGLEPLLKSWEIVAADLDEWILGVKQSYWPNLLALYREHELLLEAWLASLGASAISSEKVARNGQVIPETTVHAMLGDKRVRAEIRAHGSGDAIAHLKDGSADIGMSSRPIKPEEERALASIGNMRSTDNEHVIALDGIAAIVAPDTAADNPIALSSTAGSGALDNAERSFAATRSGTGEKGRLGVSTQADLSWSGVRHGRFAGGRSSDGG
jgi:hypothetical protein